MSLLSRALERLHTWLASHEPAWLAPMRKSIIGPLTGLALGWVTMAITATHLDLSTDQTAVLTLLVGSVVAAVVAWLIPNQPPRAARNYGWKRQQLDARDYKLMPPSTANLPAHVDLRAGFPAVYDQGQLGSCTANAISAAFAFELGRQKLQVFNPSRLAIYYWERLLEHTTRTDSGATIRDSAKVVATFGAPDESVWPYVVSKFRTAPPRRVRNAAALHRALKYEAVSQNETAMRACLAAGRPFVLGFSVYEAFESPAVARTGVVPMPAGQQLGGHAVVCVGYDDASRRFICRNSWGAAWGDGGHFTIPYSYLIDPGQAGDFWSLDVVN